MAKSIHFSSPSGLSLLFFKEFTMSLQEKVNTYSCQKLKSYILYFIIIK